MSEDNIETITGSSDLSNYIIRVSDMFAYIRRIINAGLPYVPQKRRDEFVSATARAINTMIADCKIPALGDAGSQALYKKAIASCTEILREFGKLKDLAIGASMLQDGTSIEGHEDRVSRYAAACAKYLGSPDSEKVLWYFSGLTHDIGKAGMPEWMLVKPERLTDEEFGIMRQHPELGARVLVPLETRIPELSQAHDIVRYHHQNWNGKGSYPDPSLQGEDIPLGARIIRICDAFDAMTSNRPWVKTKTHFEAALEIRENTTGQFDPQLAEQCVIPLVNMFKMIRGS